MLLNSLSDTHATRAAIAQATAFLRRRARHGLRTPGRRVRRLRRARGARPSGDASSPGSAAAGRRCCCCTATRRPTSCGTPRRRCWPSGYTVVVADLPGYGASFRPAPAPGPRAALQAGAGRRPGGGDGRARPRRASRSPGTTAAGGWPTGWPWTIPTGSRAAAVLDVVPTGEVWARADAAMALGLLALGVPRPARAAARAPDRRRPRRVLRPPRPGARPRPCTGPLPGGPDGGLPRACSTTRARCEAICEDYRAGAEHRPRARRRRPRRAPHRVPAPRAVERARRAAALLRRRPRRVAAVGPRRSPARGSTPATSSSRTSPSRSPRRLTTCSRSRPRPTRTHRPGADHVRATTNSAAADDLAGKLKRTELQHERPRHPRPGDRPGAAPRSRPASSPAGTTHPGEEVGYIVAGTVRMRDRGTSPPSPSGRRRVPHPAAHAAQRDRPRPRHGRMLSTYIVEVGEPVAVFTRR